MRPWKAAFGAGSLADRTGFNGATALRPWKGGRSASIHAAGRASMGPRPCGRGRWERLGAALTAAELQWGHGLAAVEGCPYATLYGGLPPASMGPRPCGRGRLEFADKFGVVLPGFNGATALRPWKAAGLHRPPPRRRASMGPRPCGRGRGTCPRRRAGRGVASMGPRPCGRGRRHSFEHANAVGGFNGATALRPWKEEYKRGIGNCPNSFNGATALRPWKVEDADYVHEQHFASMGPRPCGRGRADVLEGVGRPAFGFNGATALRPWKVGVLERPPSDPSGFNGATALRPWKVGVDADEQLGDRASMGPRPCGRGRGG